MLKHAAIILTTFFSALSVSRATCILDYDLSLSCSATLYSELEGALLSPQIQNNQAQCFELNHAATIACPIPEGMTAYFTTVDGKTTTASVDATHLAAMNNPLPVQPANSSGVSLPFLQTPYVTALTNYINAGTPYAQLTLPIACVGSEANGTSVCGYEIDCNNCAPGDTCWNDNSGPIVGGPNSSATIGTAVIITRISPSTCGASTASQVASSLTTIHNYFVSIGGSSSTSLPPPPPPANFTVFTGMPLITQSNPDIIKLINNSFGSKFTTDNGWCAPAATTMYLLGLKSISSPQAVFGNSYDNPVASVFDPATNATYGNYAVEEKQAADTMGYNWGAFAGGFTEADMNNIAGLTVGGSFSQGALSFAGVKADVEAGYGYLLELISYPNQTYPISSHAVAVNGVDGNYLKIYDPWGRIYDIQVVGTQTYNANIEFYNYGAESASLYKISDPVFGVFDQAYVSSAGISSLASLGYSVTPVATNVLGQDPPQPGVYAIDMVQKNPINFTKISRISGATNGYVQTNAIVYSYVKSPAWGPGDFWNSQNAVFNSIDSSWQSGVTKYLSGTTPPGLSGAPTVTTVATGGATLTAGFSGYVSSYQWYKNGVLIPGATSQSLFVIGGPGDAGAYQLVATNANGSITSATINYAPPPPPAPVSIGPAVVKVSTNGNITVSAPFSGTTTASGFIATYQWYKNGVAIVGATANVLSLSGAASDTGTYYLTASNPGGTATSPSVSYVSPAATAIIGVINSLLLGQ